jgi:hypothetical protein
MISVGTVNLEGIESLAERRFLKRTRCRIPTFVQLVGTDLYTLYRAIIHDISVTGLGLVTHGPLPLGLAITAHECGPHPSAIAQDRTSWRRINVRSSFCGRRRRMISSATAGSSRFGDALMLAPSKVC